MHVVPQETYSLIIPCLFCVSSTHGERAIAGLLLASTYLMELFDDLRATSDWHITTIHSTIFIMDFRSFR